MLIIDAHLDLAMNAMEWNRDLRLPVTDIRLREAGLNDKPDRGKGTVAFPELRKGNVGIVVATQIARYADRNNPLPGWQSPEQAWAQTQGQLSWYKAMEADGQLTMIKNAVDLENHYALWNDGESNGTKPIGCILSLEGADSIITPAYLEIACEYGLRAVGPAHYGPGRYANGTDSTGNLSSNGKELLKEMEALHLVLDVTHLCDDAFWDAMDLFNGTIWSSHHNSRSLVPHNRQASDQMLKILIEKNAVIGTALDAWMLVPGWQRGVSTPAAINCGLQQVADHLDYICQLAGNTLHAGIGSDLDGAFGKEQSPFDLETISDLQKLADILEARGYKAQDIKNIMHGNWLRIFQKALAAH
ncbi:MAG: membrane dipeptidase [Bacteroidota bacterium]